jgi:hypothetical protein
MTLVVDIMHQEKLGIWSTRPTGVGGEVQVAGNSAASV